jgi:hypothetical protein
MSTTYTIVGILILYGIFYCAKQFIKRRNHNKIILTKQAALAVDDTIDDYISISLADGGRITNAYGDTIRYDTSTK